MIKYFIIILILVISSCNGQNSNSKHDSQDQIRIIQEKEKMASERKSDNLGELISTISFKVKTNNKKDFEDGFIPWANIQNPQKDIPNLYQKDEIVIKETTIKIIIDYPLTTQYEFTLKSKNGFTREQLLVEISNNYFKLYEEEEKSATIKTIPIDKRKTMYNRNQTDGIYEIWGHDIADLDLAEIEVYKTKNGQIILKLNIYS